MSFKSTGISSNDVVNLWCDVEKYVIKALEHSEGELDENDVLEHLVKQAMQLWVIYDEDTKEIKTAMITEIMQYPKKRFCRFVGLAGESEVDWLEGDYLGVVERWAASIGCDGVESLVRPGMVKLMGKVGYHKAYDSLRS